MENKLQWAKGKALEEILKKRDSFPLHSKDWNEWNEVKAICLEQLKPSTKEEIIYFEESDLRDIPEGLSEWDHLPSIPFKIDKRSRLEYHPEQRHPIPYVIVRYDQYYFFILRESKSGEMRLIGKKGMLGGHVSKEDVVSNSLSQSLLNGLKRELYEEAGIQDDIIKSIRFRGLLKSNVGVDADHLGVIYEVQLLTKDIQSQEDGVISGIWIHQNELENHASTFESWSQIIYEQWLKFSAEKNTLR